MTKKVTENIFCVICEEKMNPGTKSFIHITLAENRDNEKASTHNTFAHIQCLIDAAGTDFVNNLKEKSIETLLENEETNASPKSHYRKMYDWINTPKKKPDPIDDEQLAKDLECLHWFYKDKQVKKQIKKFNEIKKYLEKKETPWK